MTLKRGFSDPNFEAGGESEYDREFRQACYRHCSDCHYPDCPQDCSGRQKAAAELEARKHKETANDK